MASPKDVVLQQLELGQTLIDMLTKGLSDSEYFVPPMRDGNHVGWILGHIAYSEDWTISLITGASQQMATPVAELFGGSSSCLADASGYPARGELDTLFRDSRRRTVETLGAFDDARWDEASPDDAPRDYFPTVGALWGMAGTHQFWHIGQMTMCRRALGKPPVLGA